MNSSMKYYNEDLQQLNKLNLCCCDKMKTWDIQIILEKYNFKDDADSHMAGIEFMRPWSVSKPVYHTYKTFGELIQSNDQYPKGKSFMAYQGEEKTVAIRWDFNQETNFFKLSNTKDDIVNIMIKWRFDNNPLKPADVNLDLDLLLPQKLNMYKWNVKNIILITEQQLQRLFKIMESMEKDVKEKPELFKAML